MCNKCIDKKCKCKCKFIEQNKYGKKKGNILFCFKCGCIKD